MTYASMITAAGNNQRIDLAKAAYEAARKAGCADTVTYNSMITVAGNNQRIDLAKEAYEAARKAGCAGSVTYASMIEALILNKKEEEAKNLFTTNYKENIPSLKKKQNNTYEIDLHEQNHSTTMLIMKKIITKIIWKCPETAFRMELIVGKGLHSKKKESRPPVTQAIYNLQHESFWKDIRYTPEVFEHTKNKGILVLLVEPNGLSLYKNIKSEVLQGPSILEICSLTKNVREKTEGLERHSSLLFSQRIKKDAYGEQWLLKGDRTPLPAIIEKKRKIERS